MLEKLIQDVFKIAREVERSSTQSMAEKFNTCQEELQKAEELFADLNLRWPTCVL